PAARKCTARGLPSSAAATSARSIGSRRVSSSSVPSSSTKRRRRKRSRSSALEDAAFSMTPMLKRSIRRELCELLLPLQGEKEKKERYALAYLPRLKNRSF